MLTPGDPGKGGTSGGARAAPRNVVTAPKVSWSGVKPSNAPYQSIPRSAPQSYVNRVRASNNPANPPARVNRNPSPANVTQHPLSSCQAIANVVSAAHQAQAFKEAQQNQAALRMLISGPGA